MKKDKQEKTFRGPKTGMKKRESKSFGESGRAHIDPVVAAALLREADYLVSLCDDQVSGNMQGPRLFCGICSLGWRLLVNLDLITEGPLKMNWMIRRLVGLDLGELPSSGCYRDKDMPDSIKSHVWGQALRRSRAWSNAGAFCDSLARWVEKLGTEKVPKSLRAQWIRMKSRRTFLQKSAWLARHIRDVLDQYRVQVSFYVVAQADCGRFL